MDGWHTILGLENDETILDTWEGDEKASDEGYVQIDDKDEGLLFLTNQKLVWLFRMRTAG